MYDDSATAFVLYAWCISCPFYSWYEAFTALQLPRSMERTKWTPRALECTSDLLLPVGPPGKESLHGLGLGAWLKWLRQHDGTCLVYFGVPGIFRVSGMNIAFKLTQSVFSNFCRYFVTLKLWCVKYDKSYKYSRKIQGHLSCFID